MRWLALPAIAILGLGGYGAAQALSGDAPETTATQTFTFTNEGVATYTIPTVTVTVTEPAPPPPAPPPPPPPAPLPPPPPPTCTRTLVSGGGSLQTFVNGGQAGETLCIQGTFSGNLTISSSGYTLRNVPGQSAFLTGGSGFTLVTIYGDNLTLYGLDVSGSGVRNCLLLGPGGATNQANVVNDLTLDHMRIHNCGNDNHEHAVYAEFTNRLHVVDSWLYAAGGFGITFYPNSDDALIEYSVIDGNDTGSGYAGNLQFASGDTEYPPGTKSERDTIANSLVTFASPASNQQNITTYWPSYGGTGTGHVVRDSCLWSPGDAELAGDGSYPALSNITRADPLYVNRSAGDYSLMPASPCLGKGPR